MPWRRVRAGPGQARSTAGAVHVPYGGDVRALAVDLAPVPHTPNVLLGCFEDLDSGPNPGPCCATTDNDFDGCVMEVHALGTSPAGTTTFGRLKAMDRG